MMLQKNQSIIIKIKEKIKRNCSEKCKSKDCLHCKMANETYDYKYNQYIIDGFQPIQPDTSGSDKVTDLDDGVEDKLRKFLYDLFDLSYNEIQVLKGIMNGLELCDIARQIEKNAQKNQTVSRFKVFQERKSLLKKLGDSFIPALLTQGQRKEIKI